jgi:hypothetical protein
MTHSTVYHAHAKKEVVVERVTRREEHGVREVGHLEGRRVAFGSDNVDIV